MTFCSACVVLAKELFKKPTYETSTHYDHGYRNYSREIQHLSNISDIFASAENCTFCALIRIGLEKYKSLVTDTDQGPFAIMSWEPHVHEPLVISISWGSITHQNLDYLSRCHLEIKLPINGFNAWGLGLNVWAAKNSPAVLSGDVGDVPPLDDDSSEEAFSLIRRRLSWCLASHHKCKMTMSETVVDESVGQILPKRVIDVSYLEPRLVVTENQRGHYIALSHCWGSEEKHPLRTTTDSLKKHISGIPFTTLPKTFQDAIKICREIGYQYLWIDSLCILQDSEEDWSRESQKMGSIYERARLTIAASGAKDPSKGCFVLNRPESPVIEVPYFPDSGEQIGSILVSLDMTDFEEMTPAAGPLRQRAWAAQEWTLSRRMVHYMPHGISWKCKSINEAIDDSGASYDMESYPGWCAFITYYSECKLTKESDRLVALQGITNEMQKARRDRYYLGVWSGELPQQLLWMGDKLKKNEDLLGIPSWTWASMKGCVAFPCTDTYGKFESDCDEIIIGHSRKLRMRGRTKHGTCEFAGSITLMAGDSEEDSDYSLGDNLDQAKQFLSLFDLTRLYQIKDLDGQHKENVGLAVFDSVDHIPTKFCCLSLMKGRRDLGDCNHGYGYFVLLLELSSFGEETYQRIGIGIITSDSWFDGAVSGYVTVI